MLTDDRRIGFAQFGCTPLPSSAIYSAIISRHTTSVIRRNLIDSGAFNMRCRAASSILLALFLGFAIAADKTPDAEGFVTIFDGTSLDGWKKATENPDSIQLQDGAIVANGNRCHLYYVGDE